MTCNPLLAYIPYRKIAITELRETDKGVTGSLLASVRRRDVNS